MTTDDSIIGQLFQSRDDQYEPGRQVKVLAVEPSRVHLVYLVRTEANPRRPDRVGSKSYISARTLKSRWRRIGPEEPESPPERTIRLAKAEGARAALEDLRERCVNADETLRASVKTAGSEMTRPNGKAEGVRLALSYIDDALRVIQ